MATQRVNIVLALYTCGLTANVVVGVMARAAAEVSIRAAARAAAKAAVRAAVRNWPCGPYGTRLWFVDEPF